MTRSLFNYRRSGGRPWTLLASDTFDRADSTTTLGAPDFLHASLTGTVWIEQGASQWGINGNQAYTSASLASNYATFDAGTADVDISIKLGTLNDQGLCFRFSSTSDVWILRNVNTPTSGRFSLVQRVGGVGTELVNVTGNSVGDVLRVIAVGSSIECYRNNVGIAAISDADNVTNTSHGLFNGNSTSSRLNDFFLYG